MNKILQKIYRHAYSAIFSPFEKRVSKKEFDKLYYQIKKEYLLNKDNYVYEKFLDQHWINSMRNIEKIFLTNFPFSFLNLQVIKETMFVYSYRNWRNIQKKLISHYFNAKEARRILREYNLGRPLLNDAKYISSANSIHHLYHLTKFLLEVKVDFNNINSIVEIGGGYGNMAKISKLLKNNITYTIIDIPIFSYIQALFLKTIFGPSMVNILNKNNTIIKNGIINIVPLDVEILSLVGKSLENTDLFISTWALSESNKNMQDAIKALSFFKSKYILLAYQVYEKGFSHSEDVKDLGKEYRIIYNKETEYTKDNYYLFASKII